jgi:hypothetical protein
LLRFLHGNQHAQQGSDCCSIRLREAQQFERQEQNFWQILLDRFHTTRRDHLRRILGPYTSPTRLLKRDWNLSARHNVRNQQPAWYVGYAYNAQWFGGRGAIHICFDKTGCDFATTAANNQVALVIHEAAHPHGGIDDKAYAGIRSMRL